MSGARLAMRQVRYENTAFWRNPAAAFFTVAFPLMFLVIFNLLFGREPITVSGGTVPASTFFVPAIVAFSVVTATFTNLAIGVSFARDSGLLKRVRGTPLPGWSFILGKVGHATLIALLLATLVTAAGALVYDVDVPTTTMPAFVLTVVVGVTAFSSLGLAMTAAVPNADAAPAIVNAVVLPLLFISDVFIRLDDPPGWLDAVGSLFPIKHASEALQAAFDPFRAGAGFEWGDLAVLAAWGAAGILLAIRFFSWEPRR